MNLQKKKSELKNLITATNILIAVIIVIYLLDCYLPLPEGYTGYTSWDSELPPAVNYIFGSCGGLLSNSLAMGGPLENANAVYRHFTQMFLHGGLLHLVANILGLYFIGNFAEKKYGHWLTPLLFVLIAFLESYITDPLYIAMFPAKAEEVAETVSVGASAGIFGLAGAGLCTIFFDMKSFKKIGKPTIIVSVIYGIFTTYIVGWGWTTVCHNVAFLLGLAFGAAIILPFYILRKGKFATEIREEEDEKDDKDKQ